MFRVNSRRRSLTKLFHLSVPYQSGLVSRQSRSVFASCWSSYLVRPHCTFVNRRTAALQTCLYTSELTFLYLRIQLLSGLLISFFLTNETHRSKFATPSQHTKRRLKPQPKKPIMEIDEFSHEMGHHLFQAEQRLPCSVLSLIIDFALDRGAEAKELAPILQTDLVPIAKRLVRVSRFFLMAVRSTFENHRRNVRRDHHRLLSRYYTHLRRDERVHSLAETCSDCTELVVVEGNLRNLRKELNNRMPTLDETYALNLEGMEKQIRHDNEVEYLRRKGQD